MEVKETCLEQVNLYSDVYIAMEDLKRSEQTILTNLSIHTGGEN